MGRAGRNASLNPFLPLPGVWREPRSLLVVQGGPCCLTAPSHQVLFKRSHLRLHRML